MCCILLHSAEHGMECIGGVVFSERYMLPDWLTG
jgi:hypothetical protein